MLGLINRADDDLPQPGSLGRNRTIRVARRLVFPQTSSCFPRFQPSGLITLGFDVRPHLVFEVGVLLVVWYNSK